jgi:hypothetical protein
MAQNPSRAAAEVDHFLSVLRITPKKITFRFLGSSSSTTTLFSLIDVQIASIVLLALL